jgi:hypothetical protein
MGACVGSKLVDLVKQHCIKFWKMLVLAMHFSPLDTVSLTKIYQVFFRSDGEMQLMKRLLRALGFSFSFGFEMGELKAEKSWLKKNDRNVALF